jgi:VWFA-related protein
MLGQRLLVMGLLTCPLLAQQNPSTEPGSTIRLDVNLVSLDVAVTDRSGRPISGLKQGDFRLTVDNAPRAITVFHGEDIPVAAGIVVDDSSSMAPKREQVIAAALAFARASNPRDQMFVVNFSERPALGLPPNKPFTDDIPELETALSRSKPFGRTALYDALALAIHHLRDPTAGRTALLVVSDGADNHSRTTYPQILQDVKTAGTIVYAIGLFDETSDERSPRILKKLAEVSGGKAFFPAELEDVTRICTGIAKDIRSRYVLGFPAPSTGGQHHRIELIAQNTKHGRLKVHTRTGYYDAEPKIR